MKFLVFSTDNPGKSVGFVHAEDAAQAIAHAKKKYHERSPLVRSESGDYERNVKTAYERSGENRELVSG
jgi:1,2-phenylacetyl-CoA epoxidase PaaB subunit